MSIEAMKQALEALERIAEVHGEWTNGMWAANKALSAIPTLRTAIEKAEKQEPDYKALYEKASQQYNELAALMDKPAPVQEPDLTEIPMIMTCTKCGAFGEAMLTLETQPAQKPVNVTSKMVQAFLYAAGRHFPWGGSDPAIEDGIKAALEAMPTPPAAQRQSARSAWVGLSEEEILKLAYPIRWQEVDDFEADKAINFAQTIEAKLREKNGGAA